MLILLNQNGVNKEKTFIFMSFCALKAYDKKAHLFVRIYLRYKGCGWFLKINKKLKFF